MALVIENMMLSPWRDALAAIITPLFPHWFAFPQNFLCPTALESFRNCVFFLPKPAFWLCGLAALDGATGEDH
jgi:hypothetical protein